LNQLFNSIPSDWIHNNEGPDTWSPFDIVGHLIHGEKTDWIPRAKIILEGDSSRQFDSFDRFAQFEASKGKTIVELLKKFEELRIENITTLKLMDINDEKLNMQAQHPELGAASLKQLLSCWVAHDLSHINQITRVLAKNYSNEVGPWRKYMTLLST